MRTGLIATCPGAAWGILILYLTLAIWGVTQPAPAGAIKLISGQSERSAKPTISDSELYSQVIDQLRLGHSYYQSVAQLYRTNGYPLHPFVTVRLPTLAWLSAALGDTPTFMLYLALIASNAWLWWRRLWAVFAGRLLRLYLPILAYLSLSVTVTPVAALLHDAWAGALISIGLVLWRPERIWPSIIVLFFAALFREMAACVLFLMIALAAYERRWREVASWAGAIACFAVVITAHAIAVADVVRQDDMHSSGWIGLGGWPLVVSAIMSTSPLIAVPRWVAALAAPLMVMGWMYWRDPLALRVVGVVTGFGLAIALFARPDTFYWALLFASLLLPGLLFVPDLVRDVICGIGTGLRPRNVS